MNRRAGEPQECFFEVKNSMMERAMTWGVVMMEHPLVCNVWYHANHPFSEPFKCVFIKNFKKSITDMLKTIAVEDFQRCYQKWEQHLYQCVAAQGNYFEGDNIDV